LLLDVRQQGDELRQKLLQGGVLNQLETLGVVLVGCEGPASKFARQSFEPIELHRLAADEGHDRRQEFLVPAGKVCRILVSIKKNFFIGLSVTVAFEK